MASRLDQLVSSPAAGLDEPFAMLHACHERMQRTLALLGRLEAHVAEHGADEQARQAARDVARYFDNAAPQHHLDEERHVLPALRAGGDPALAVLAARLENDHRAMESAWAAARAVLQQIADGTLARLDPEQEQSLQSFTQLYAGHIAAEEGTAFPTAEARLDADAVRAMSADMRARRGAS
ncbi:hemerythrin domain-containing protein [Ramlibacter algicola]|uniref:Hemerythrin domain-containing protein n=1 Tax=Ramlibacter algicola TaxID=2795217 RepID=A0A934Q2E8_9BURK|nr:hemerythrin domain-containing protein [Ramlibacter algicola]MBK0393558.1 hemerythrin domain-containing protein [Ramlibacter algicola]